MTTTKTPTVIEIDPYLPLDRYVGRELGYETSGGDVLVGTTEIGQGAANGGRLIVRFDNGQWGFANYTHRKGAR